MCNDFSININNSDYNVDVGQEQDFTITINETPEVVINLNEQGPAGMHGETGEQGPQGERGYGVDRVEPIAQEGYTVTYRMYFTDGRYFDYDVTNGTGSLKWITITQSDWVPDGDRYKYTYSGSYGIIDLFEGSISSKSKIEYDTTIEGSTTYIYSLVPIDGYALAASIDNEDISSVYIYEQVTPSDTWVINHGLNTRPSITVVDSAGDVVVGSETYNDNYTVTIKFSSAFSGEAYLNYTR